MACSLILVPSCQLFWSLSNMFGITMTIGVGKTADLGPGYQTHISFKYHRQHVSEISIYIQNPNQLPLSCEQLAKLTGTGWAGSKGHRLPGWLHTARVTEQGGGVSVLLVTLFKIANFQCQWVERALSYLSWLWWYWTVLASLVEDAWW